MGAQRGRRVTKTFVWGARWPRVRQRPQIGVDITQPSDLAAPAPRLEVK